MTPKPNLDLLRTIAVSLVIVDHTILAKGIQRWRSWYIGEIGLFGVYLFFVHTSLVLMWSLERRPNVLDFYIRRLFRIYPLAIVTILIAAATHAPVGGTPAEYFHTAPITWKSVLYNCTLMQDLIGHSVPIHGVTWSLPLELYMYFVLPCLFFYARSVRRVWPILLIWILAAVISYRCVPATGNNIAVVIPDFLAGIIAYAGFMSRRPTLPSWTLPPLLVLLFVFYMNHHNIRADWFACLALGLVLPSTKQFQWQPARRASHLVSTYSYGIYLFHPFSIVIGMYLLAERPLAVQLSALLLTLVMASIASYHAIESPMIRFGALFAARTTGEHGLPSPQSLEELEPAS